MIEIIEKIRKNNGFQKSELCKVCRISPQMYRKYLNGSKLPVDYAKLMLNYMDHDLIVAVKFKL